jgi:hypothetical protein
MHHGVIVDSGRVVHFSGGPGRKLGAVVRVDTLEDFAEGGTVRVKRHARRLTPEEATVRAMFAIGRRGYNLVFNNCEHFATYCVTGKPVSHQVRRVRAVAGFATARSLRLIALSGRFGFLG